MEVKRRNYSIGNIVLFLTIGGVFTALGIALLAITFDGVIKYGIALIGAGIIMPIVLILALLGFGITALVMGGKQIYLWIRGSITLKRGKDATAKIVGHKSASFGKRTNTCKRYALVLSYNNGEENKTFTTDYLFDINEFRYLSRLECIKVKINGNFISVCEPFPKDIYKVDSTYGIELVFYKQKPVAILLRLWVVFFVIALVLFIVSMVVGNGAFTKAAVIILFIINFPFAITLAVYLIKWFNRKK